MTTYKRIEAVKKAGEILKYLANQKEPVNGPAIATAVNLPVGTVMCHLATLEDLGFVRTLGDRFEIGMNCPFSGQEKRPCCPPKRRELTGI